MAATTETPAGPDEKTIWTGSPSHVMNFWTYLVCGILSPLIIPIFIIIWKWIELRSVVYEVTTERIRIKTGIFARLIDEVELYRVRDYHLEQPFLLRLFGVYNIILITSDKSTPKLVLEGVKDGESLRDEIRKNVERLRLEKKVREIDME